MSSVKSGWSKEKSVASVTGLLTRAAVEAESVHNAEVKEAIKIKFKQVRQAPSFGSNSEREIKELDRLWWKSLSLSSPNDLEQSDSCGEKLSKH